MKYVRPEIELMKVRKEDIITLSYMLPPIEIDTGSEENTDTVAE